MGEGHTTARTAPDIWCPWPSSTKDLVSSDTDLQAECWYTSVGGGGAGGHLKINREDQNPAPPPDTPQSQFPFEPFQFQT
jgi:hypothetical protein